MDGASDPAGVGHGVDDFDLPGTAAGLAVAPASRVLVLGLGYSLVTRDKLGLVVAFAGVTLLARAVVSGRQSKGGK